MNRKLVCIVGETSSGKDTMVSAVSTLLSKYNDSIMLIPVISYATRPMRDGEVNGREHYFITDEDANQKMKDGNVIAYTKIEKPGIKGYEYFVTEESIGNSNLYVIDPNGIEYMKSKCPDTELLIVYIHTPSFIRRLRAMKRSDYRTSYDNRVKSEKEQFKKFKKEKRYDIKIRNYTGLQWVSARILYENIKKFLS